MNPVVIFKRNDMRFLTRFIAAASLTLVAATAGATPDNPQAGTDYRVLDKPQQTESGNKVEVTEFFGYFCPHCNAFEPKLEDWVKKQGNNIVFKRVPVIFRDFMVPQQKLYFALDAMGKADEMQKKVFRAIHADHQQLDTEAQIMEFIGKQPGIDKQKFADLYNSFGVQTKVNRVPALQQAYQIDGVPTLAVNGRYVTSPSIVAAGMGNVSEAALQDAALKVMDFLVAKAAKEHPGAAAPAKATEPAAKKKH